MKRITEGKEVTTYVTNFKSISQAVVASSSDPMTNISRNFFLVKQN